MTFVWLTKNINIQTYYKVIKRCIMLNGDDDTAHSGYKTWQEFKERWTIYVVPLEKAEEYKKFYEHLKLEGSGGMAWGITGKDVLYWFITDSRNPFIFRQNVGPGFHESLHAMYQQVVGTQHVSYIRDEPPEKTRKGQTGPAATVIVHDNWYGFKTSIKMWFLHSMWVPTNMPYIPIKVAKKLYGL